MTPEEGLRRSLAEFQATLDSMRLAGVSQVAEVQQLRHLVMKYPDRARHFLAGLDLPGRRGRHRAEKRSRPFGASGG
ncbi:hypothetical protein [Actinoallomurus soli]|uniref:hypothetical protein n=1 Tax=Actinoallomurus soli TaxID=2952535 RepID=UPI00209215BF|nr:hypothetical protein [Actinoallomurus soli]MCO5969799.1 hypothetical protein [Actinoallomurus soli]